MCNDTENLDRLKIKIQNSISEGQIFKSMAAVYRTIGLELLGIHDLNGGKQCDTARKIVEQYARFESVTSSGHSVQCVEIFEEPRYLEKTDGRGKNGFYVDRLVPLLLRYLHNQEDNEWTTSISNLAVTLGMVKQDYSNLAKLDEYFAGLYRILHISEDYCHQFYYRTKFELLPRLTCTLNRLKKAGILDYENRFLIKEIGGGYHLSDKWEFSTIQNTEKMIVEQMEAKNKRTIYLRKKGRKFEQNVMRVLNETYELNWEFYVPRLHLRFKHDCISDYILEKYPGILAGFKDVATEVRKHFAQTVRKKTLRDYARTNRPMHSRAGEIFDQLKADELICMFYDEDELEDMAEKFARQWMSEMKKYYYHPDYLPKQDRLIRFFIG